MESFQIDSIESPFDDRVVYSQAFRVLIRTQMMGLWDPPSHVRLDSLLYASVLRSVQTAGIATGLAGVEVETSAEDWATAWGRVLDAVEASPHPAGEWGPARQVLGDELLARLVNVSESSLRRYSAGARPTPDDTAWRLHAIGQITSALAGSYNAFGIRRWFERRREQLGGTSPKDALRGDWSPDDEEVRRVTELAEALVGAGSAT